MPGSNSFIGVAGDGCPGSQVFQAPNIAACAAFATPINGHVTQFSRCAIGSFQHLTIDNNTTAYARAYGKVNHVLTATPGAKHIFTQSCRVRVVFNNSGPVKLLL